MKEDPRPEELQLLELKKMKKAAFGRWEHLAKFNLELIPETSELLLVLRKKTFLPSPTYKIRLGVIDDNETLCGTVENKLHDYIHNDLSELNKRRSYTEICKILKIKKCNNASELLKKV